MTKYFSSRRPSSGPRASSETTSPCCSTSSTRCSGHAKSLCQGMTGTLRIKEILPGDLLRFEECGDRLPIFVHRYSHNLETKIVETLVVLLDVWQLFVTCTARPTLLSERSCPPRRQSGVVGLTRPSDRASVGLVDRREASSPCRQPIPYRLPIANRSWL